MNSLNEIIRAEAAKRGALPFARFMELALYHPELGYYETAKHSPGRGGDFYTSVSTGSLFGELLAFQFAEWLREFQISNFKFQIIEAGAHDGRLAADILGWLQIHRPKLFDRIEYVILEPSPRRQEWQRETLKMFAPRVRWASSFQSLFADTPHSALRTPHLSGILFSNELLDAFPVHRFGWNAKEKKWFEWGVAVAGDKFVWAKLDSEFRIPNSELEAVLPDGYTAETSPAAENWWREAAGLLAHGKLLTIDYGFTADEMFSPARTGGTLRAYFRHHATDDILANPGEQDITAHVNFSAIRKAGENAGLTTEFFGSQAKFLVDILAATAKDSLSGKWNVSRTRQFQTLTHPEHLGRAFRVLVQSIKSSS
jgi:SAM-dependent MidA family methyltransferase